MAKIYETLISKDKQDNFLVFLRKLNIKDREIKLTHSRGDFYFYEIDLSEKSDEALSNIRTELNNTQVEFL